MRAFLVNLVLALVWVALLDRATFADVLFGFLLGFVALAWLRPVPEVRTYVRRLPRALGLLLFFLWELVVSSLQVAWAVVNPWKALEPAVVAVPLDAETDFEITLLACLVTLTPGTVSIDVTRNRRSLIVHGMFVSDPEELIRSIKDGFERRVLELLR